MGIGERLWSSGVDNNQLTNYLSVCSDYMNRKECQKVDIVEMIFASEQRHNTDGPLKVINNTQLYNNSILQ